MNPAERAPRRSPHSPCGENTDFPPTAVTEGCFTIYETLKISLPVTTTSAPRMIAEPFTKIRPSSGWAALNLEETWKFRDLLLSLATRDLKLRYKQTALGVIWVVAQPLMAAGIFSFVFGKVARLPSDGVPYLLFSFAGLLGWNLFSSTVTKCSGCLVGNSQLISKVFFPRLILPLSTIPSVLVDFAVAAGMMIVLMFVYGVAPGWGVLLLPVWMAMLLMLALGIGLSTAALAVSYRDVQYIVPVFMQILLYASPIAYAVSAVPAHLRSVYLLNPLSAPLEAFRASLLQTTWPGWQGLAISAAFSALIFLLGLYSFKRMERQFADVI
jgi:lipopolysaccharide transport system permease protein